MHIWISIHYNTIINKLANLQQLYDAGKFDVDPLMPVWETNNRGQTKFDKDGEPVLAKDGDGNEIASRYNETSIASGVGDVFQVRHYYDSGRPTPYYLYRNGEYIRDYDNIVSMAQVIENYANKMHSRMNKEKEEEGTIEDRGREYIDNY